MSKEESLQELDRRLERLEKLSVRRGRQLTTATALCNHLNAQTDHAMAVICELQNLARINAQLLHSNSIAITRRAILDELRKYEREELQRKRFYRGHPGVSKKVRVGRE